MELRVAIEFAAALFPWQMVLIEEAIKKSELVQKRDSIEYVHESDLDLLIQVIAGAASMASVPARCIDLVHKPRYWLKKVCFSEVAIGEEFWKSINWPPERLTKMETSGGEVSACSLCKTSAKKFYNAVTARSYRAHFCPDAEVLVVSKDQYSKPVPADLVHLCFCELHMSADDIERIMNTVRWYEPADLVPGIQLIVVSFSDLEKADCSMECLECIGEAFDPIEARYYSEFCFIDHALRHCNQVDGFYYS